MGVPDSRHIPEGAEVDLPGGFRGTLLTRSDDRSGPQGVYLVEHGSAQYVYKVYGARRNWVKQCRDRVYSFLEGRSGPAPAVRRDVEQRALALWREHGFSVFPQPESAPAIDFGAPVLCVGYVPGRTAYTHFADPAISREDKFRLLRTLVADWARRHELARRLSEPLLVQEHPSLEHIWLGEDGRSYYFDFEVVFWKRSRLHQFIGREILRYTRAVVRCVPEEESEEYLDLVLRHYPLPEFFRIAYVDLWRHPNPFVRAFRFFERLTERARRPLSSFEVIRRIIERLPDVRES